MKYSSNNTQSQKNGNADINVGSWITVVQNLNTARRDLAGIGTSNSSVLAFGGNVPSPPGTEVANSEFYNGSSWSAVNALNQARDNLAGGGTATSGLAFGGLRNSDNNRTDETETWNGLVWAEVNDLGTARRQVGGTMEVARPQPYVLVVKIVPLLTMLSQKHGKHKLD